MRISYTGITLVATAALYAAATVDATPLAIENFEDKSLAALNGQTGGTGFSGSWSANSANANISVVNASLSYSNGDVGSNGGSQALQVTFNDDTIVDNLFSREFSSSISGTVYMSFLFREITNPNFGTDFIQVGFDDASPDQPLVSALRRNGAYQVRSGTSSPANTTQGTTPADIGTTHLLVIKAEKVSGSSSYNQVSLFYDPSSLTETAFTARSTTNSGLTTSTFLSARSAFHEAGDTLQIDNLRVGESWSDVVTAVPESSAALLLTVATLGLLRRRR